MSFDKKLFLHPATLLLSMIAMGATYYYMLTVTLPHLEILTGGLKIFDMRPGGYSPDEARDLLAALAGEGTEYYRNVQLRLDIMYPLLFAVALGMCNYKLLMPLPQKRILSVLTVVLIFAPILTCLFDWYENWLIHQMLAQGPNSPTELIERASRITSQKSGFTIISWIGLVIGAGRYVKMKLLSQ